MPERFCEIKGGSSECPLDILCELRLTCANMIARPFSFLVNAAFAALVVGAALPGTHRVIMPQAYGMTEISSRVWSDAPQDARSMRGMANTARKRVVDFFGDVPPKPTLILCTTRKCAADFGIRGNGLSIADVAVMVAPGGLTLGTLTHEMTHSRLHRDMGIKNIIRQPYPTWFDEGLATHVANHPIWRGEISAAARARVKDVRRSWHLRAAFGELGVGRTYRAAAAEVADIERRAGRSGLLELIARAEAGEDFESVLSEVMDR